MTRPREPRLTGDARTATARQWQADYYAGSSIQNLVDRTGYSYGTVRSLLLLVDTKLRPRGTRPRPFAVEN